MSDMKCESCGCSVKAGEPGVLVVSKNGERRTYCPSHAKSRPTRVRKPKRQRGWDLIHGMDARWEKAQRSAGLLPWEGQRIRSGDYSPLIREYEPRMQEGHSIVVAWERSRPYADHEEGTVFRTTARPVLWITITSKVRRARGGWAVRFDVNDTRDKTEYLRRVPPAQGADNATEEEAHLASNYTSDTRVAIEAVPIVPHEDLERFAAEARVANIVQDSEQVEQRLARIVELPARDRLVALHKLASDRGVDVRDDVKAFERRLLRRLGKAA